MVSLFLRQLFMSVFPSVQNPNGKSSYAGRYHDGRAIYFYDNSNGNRVYNGRFWIKRESYSLPLGSSFETAKGCFHNDKKNGKWKFSNKTKGLHKILIADYSDGRYEGLYFYKSVCHSRMFNFMTGTTILRMQMSDGIPVGDVIGNFCGEELSGHYDSNGCPDGLWKMDRTKKGLCYNDYELWEHGVCKESYSIDESTGEKTKNRNQLPNLVMNILYKEGSHFEHLTKKSHHRKNYN